MNIIEYHRYTVNDDKSLNDIIDHTEYKADNDLNFVKVIETAESWLKDHFGHVDVVYQDYETVIDNKEELVKLINADSK